MGTFLFRGVLYEQDQFIQVKWFLQVREAALLNFLNRRVSTHYYSGNICQPVESMEAIIQLQSIHTRELIV